MRIIILLLTLLPLLTFSQNSYNLGLVGEYEWNTTEGNDIWGWVNPTNGNEYALVGLNNGFSCVNVSSPANPVEEFFISDLNSTWRDVKTWGDYAFVTTEADARNFKEYEFSVEGLSEFSAFAVKIVGQGTNTSVVPMISALRCIALA